MSDWIGKYQHRFRVRAALPLVAKFHMYPASMSAITPPPILVKIHQAPDVLTNGDRMAFTMWLGPLPVFWEARIEAVSPDGFIDRQMSGPFAEWVHGHTFMIVDEQTTEVVDEVTLRLSKHPFWWLVGLGMRLGLPMLFAFRRWKTKRILE
jgi:ligand-binding SRPBCC domain-containing protein